MARNACSTKQQLDFDDWSQLAATDPAAFEARRERMINDFIDSAPPEKRQRLRGLQWRIDQTRRRSKTPLAACIRISEMMWDSMMGEDGLLERMEMLSGRRPAPAEPRRKAEVLSFRDPSLH